MTKDEALKLALEALEEYAHAFGANDLSIKAMYVAREALAQPEQHQDWCASLTQLLMSMPPKPAPCNCKPPQRTWVGLTDLENAEFVKTMERGNFLVAIYDIEKKLKEKNT